jgi:hypothetical protein
MTVQKGRQILRCATSPVILASLETVAVHSFNLLLQLWMTVSKEKTLWMTVSKEKTLWMTVSKEKTLWITVQKGRQIFRFLGMPFA